jgi:hypothetical protein
MKQRPMIMNIGNMSLATRRALGVVKHVTDMANAMATDPRQGERLKKHECRACFYSGRISGAAMTERDCMSCGGEQQYGSTATDALCLPCAKAHSLCKHCGGDLDMRTQRKHWPEPTITEG